MYVLLERAPQVAERHIPSVADYAFYASIDPACAIRRKGLKRSGCRRGIPVATQKILVRKVFGSRKTPVSPLCQAGEGKRQKSPQTGTHQLGPHKSLSVKLLMQDDDVKAAQPGVIKASGRRRGWEHSISKSK